MWGLFIFRNMQPSQLQAQASQAAQQGQQLLSQDQSQAASSQNDYNNYRQQATQANQQQQQEAAYMQGAGSGQNVYNTQLASGEKSAGFDPSQMAAANKSLFTLTGALNGANAQFGQPGGVGSYGMSAPALASYESSILTPLQTGVANANTEVGTFNQELGTLQTGAQQATSNQVQSEQNVVSALNNAVVNYQAQADSALKNMQFYSGLAQSQGQLNSQEAASYAAAYNSYESAQQAIAQAKYIMSQTAGQDLTNQQTQAAMDAAKAQNNATATQNATRNAENAGYEVSSSNANKGLTRAINSGQRTYAYGGVSF